MKKKAGNLETDRMMLREIDSSDSEFVVKLRSNIDVYKYFKNPHKITLEEHDLWFKYQYKSDENRYDFICIEKGLGTKLGIMGFVRKNNIVEVNYILDSEAQHKGYASEGIKELIKYIVSKWMVDEIIAEIHKDNKNSIAFIKRLGFSLKEEIGDFYIYRSEGCNDLCKSRC